MFIKQFSILKEFLFKLSKFEHFVTNPIMKVFLDKKIELKQTMDFIYKQYKQSFDSKDKTGDISQNQEDLKLYDYADRLREYFPNLAVKVD
mgnify:CR=1 FL=1